MENKEIASKLIELAHEIYPDQKSEEFWTINIKKGQTIESTLVECKKLFSIWRGNDDNLDQLVNSDRTSKETYSVKIAASIEADENLKNLSANRLKEKGIKGITLLERLQLEIDYFKKTGKHPDLINVTLCTGSRYSGGGVPFVYWRSARLNVFWCLPDYADDGLRAREVVY